MPILREIRVQHFRSIRSAQIKPLESYEAIVGLNSAGKSNLLRALKLFFTGSIDERGTLPNISRDYSDYGPQKGKRISVGVEFALGGEISYPRQNSFIQSKSLLKTVAIQQSWYIDSQTRTTVRRLEFGADLDHLTEASDPGDIAQIEGLIRAIEFRYIPNHARPSELIDQYVSPLRGALVSRLQKTKEYKAGGAGELLTAMSRLGDTLFSQVSRSVEQGIKGLTVRSDLPTDFADLAFDLAVRSVDASGHRREPELEGSGTQQFMFLHLLDLADRTSRGAGFGWVQGSIWAVEEPESFLHAGLRQRFAQDLNTYSSGDRRQIFLTTHQDEFLRVSSSAIVASNTATGTTFERFPSKEALIKSARMAITSFRHPLLQYPDQPLVLLEGKFDAIYLRAALKASNLKPRWRLGDPDELTGDDAGGDTFKSYLRYNSAALASRPDTAPILIVRDWETKDVAQYQKHLSAHPYSGAVVMPQDLCNPLLGSSWAGIERYLPSDYIESTIPPEDLLKRGGSAIVEIDKQQLASHKAALAFGFETSGYSSPELVQLVKWIDSQVEGLLQKIPTTAFV